MGKKPGYISEKNKNTNSKRYVHPKVHSSIIYSSQNMEADCPSTDKWINKIWCVCIYIYIHTHTHTYNGILLSHKKEWNVAICSNMDGHGGHYAKWNKSDRERQILYDITYMWNLKTTASVYNKKEEDSQM